MTSLSTPGAETADRTDQPGVRCPGERLQVIGWIMQLVGTAALLLGISVALFSLPKPVDGRFPPDMGVDRFLILLGAAFAVGLILLVVATVLAVMGRRQARAQLGSSRPVAKILRGWQRGIALFALSACLGALAGAVIPLILAIQS